ncbi:MAG: serine hydrolase [Pseudomonadota bacterium]
MRFFKWLFILIVAVIVVAAGLLALNFDKVQRLLAVNSLFSEEKIVANFSGMNTLFFNKDIPSSGEVTEWEEALKPLPESFQSGESNQNVTDWLAVSKTTSLLVIQDGKIAYENYYLDTKPDDLRVSWSVAKSFLSAAFGVAVSEGKIDLEKPVETYVVEFAGSAYEGVSVRNVLNMASGVTFDEDYLEFWSDINKMGRTLAIGGSMDQFAIDLKGRDREPGVSRQYVSIDTHVLAMVLRAATGETLPDYLAEKLITPLGFSKQPYYLTDSEGNAFALGGLNITTRDYARFGQMFLDYGKWQGAQVVPSGWVLESTIASAPPVADSEKQNGNDQYNYGYQWWVPADSTSFGGDYLARGIYGQYIYISPKTKTVIVRTAANRNFRGKVEDGRFVNLVNLDMFRAVAAHVSQ